MSEVFRKPNGDITSDIIEYANAWEEFSKPFEKVGFTILGYDPLQMYIDKKGVFTLPLYAANIIYPFIKEK